MQDSLLEFSFAVIKLFLIVAFGVLCALEYGWVFSTIWAWFAVPLGAPVIATASAAGIVIAIRVATYRWRWTPSNVSKTDLFLSMVLAPLMMLLSAWIIKQFM